MSLSKLDIYSFRNIKQASIEPSPAINLITGDNGSGKSSLLEAIFVLGRARSFRATHIKQLIQFDKEQFIVSGKIIQNRNHASHLGIKLHGTKCDIRINQSNSHKADLAYALPVLLIHPKSYKLIDAGPQLRREFLDWGVFNTDEHFLSCWRKFKKVLQHRNSLLKNRQVNQLHVWDTELIEYGTIVSDYRKAYLNQLQPLFLELSIFFLDLHNVEIKYIPGWNDSDSFDQAIKNDLQRDLKYGFTHSGPHRGDFCLWVEGRLAKDFVSRGQLKLLMISLMLAQVKLINADQGCSVCLLIDDLTAELDRPNKAKLLNYLSRLNCQVFMSTTELCNFGDLSLLDNYKVFHVEHGQIGLVE